MKTYTILYAEDVPHYVTVEIQATTDDEAIRKAKARSTKDLNFQDPDWNNPILQRIVHIEDDTGHTVANDISLSDRVLLDSSQILDATMKPMQDSEPTKPTARRRGLRRSITIDASFGGEMQRDVATRLLDQFLASWKKTAESHHKKNAIRIIRDMETAFPHVTVG